jgi:hypothetical protein
VLDAVGVASYAALQKNVRLRRIYDDFASRQNRPRQLRRSQAGNGEDGFNLGVQTLSGVVTVTLVDLQGR